MSELEGVKRRCVSQSGSECGPVLKAGLRADGGGGQWEGVGFQSFGWKPSGKQCTSQPKPASDACQCLPSAGHRPV